jgi:hypothetical protein
MINRLSAILCGLVIMGMMLFAQSSEAAAPAAQCVGNWVNAPCVVAEETLAPAEPRLVPQAVAPRREVHRSKRAAQRKLVNQKAAHRKVVQQKVAQQKPVRVAMRTAKVCTGNWVNAACASP